MQAFQNLDVWRKAHKLTLDTLKSQLIEVRRMLSGLIRSASTSAV